MNKKLHFLYFICIFLIFCTNLNAQYYKEHYIAPAPWQYWSTANEIVIGTLSAAPATVQLKKSDGTLLTTLTVALDAPVSYRFAGDAFALTRNLPDVNYTDRGLIVEATEPVLVNLRNIATDASQGFIQLGTGTIKGNASLVSFGKEGLGMAFRLGYYRKSTAGLFNGAPVYSVMATEDNTVVSIPTGGTPLTVTLQTGESRLFKAPLGSLLTADKPVVMNTGSWGDVPQTCGANGEDGAFDQIAPVNVLGTQYLVVRGRGTAPTAGQQTLFYGPEQTLVVASEDNTQVTVQHFNAAGVAIGTPLTIPLALAGNFESFYHGDGQNQYSSSLIIADKPIIVYSGTAVGCETDISTVLPIGGCAGSTNIQTKKFIDYNDGGLDYFAFTVIESQTVPVMLNGADIETLTGVTRTTLGTSGFDMIRFTRTQIGNPANLLLSSTMPLTTSIVQQQDNVSSMSAFFSAFGAAALAPVVVTVNDDCTVTIEAQQDPDITQYEWFRNGISIGTTDENHINVTESGNYTVKVQKGCGWGNMSMPTAVEVNPCSDLSVIKEVKSQLDEQAVFKITVKNNDAIFTDNNVTVHDALPSGYTFVSYTASQGTYDPVTGDWSIGALAPGQEESLEITVTINENGEYINVATVEGENIDKDPGNNSDDAIVNFGKMSLTKTAEKKEYERVGEIIVYTLEIKNTGDQPLRNVRITDTNADAGSISPATFTVINPNETVTAKANHTITINDFIAGQVQNQAKAVAETPIGSIEKVSDDPTTTLMDDPTIVNMIRVADLNATKDDGIIYYQPGQETHYVIVVKNNGPSSAVNVLVEDPMPAGVSEMSWSSTIGTSGTGNLRDIVPLIQVGETVTYNVKVRIPNNQKGDFVNTVYATSELNEDRNPLCDTCVDIDRQEVVIPKGISPNGDGLNDFLDLEPFYVAKITIFNRLGKEVYSKVNYKNEWKGQSNSNKELPDGVYFYHILIIGGFEHTGYIQLTREVK